MTPAGKSELINNMVFPLLSLQVALKPEIAFHIFTAPDLGGSVRNIITFYWIEKGMDMSGQSTPITLH